MLVVVGLGQPLRGDDGVGVEAVAAWQAAYPETACHPAVRVHLAEAPGLGLLDLIGGASAALLVDAVRSGAPPGTLHLLQDGDLESFAGGARSAHGWGVAETLALARIADPGGLPARLQILGVEAGGVEPGAGLSPALRAALPEIAARIQALVVQMLADLPGGAAKGAQAS